MPPFGLSEIRFVDIMFPMQAGHQGALFGGTARSLMSTAAAIAAARCAGAGVVMASAKIDFHMPVAVGQHVELCARVERVGRCLMMVKVSVLAEAPGLPEPRLAMQGSFEMVAVNADGHPTPIAAATAKV